MAGNRDLIEILREIRGSGVPGETYTNGIWYDLTIADKNGNPGIYGDILAKYGIVTESAGTFDQAVAILENLNVEVTTLPAGSQATSALVNGVWQIGIPRGLAGTDGEDGSTPVVAINYVAGDLKYAITVNGVQITNTTLVNLDGLVDTRVNANVDVQTTLTAKQEVLDAVAVTQGIVDGLDANVAGKIVELSNHTITKIGELNTASAAEQLEISTTADAEKLAYDQNATVKVTQYNDNHITKLAEYDANDELKIEQYNANHVERLENLDEKYATRIIDMLNTNKILGMVDKFAATVPTQYATFLDTATGSYIYYLNGVMLTETTDYTIVNSTTIELTNVLAYGDIVTQVDSQYIGDYLTFEGVLLEESVGQPNGVAGLDETGKVPAAQLPSYVDDVIEVATKVALPTTGEVGKIYVVVTDETSNGDTSSYRWTGSVYAMVSNTLSAIDVKALYESNPDTNAFTDAAEILLGIGTVLTTTATTLPTAINELQEHVVNDGSDHSFINQDVKTTATPKFIGVQLTGGIGTQGTMTWNAGEETVDLIQNGATLQMGQELQTHVRNGTASTIANGRVVMATGTIGASGRIVVGLYNGTSAVKYILGVTTEDVLAGDDGKVTHFGKVRGINTSAWNEYDLLYPTANGLFTNVAPTTGVRVALAMVITKHAVNGTIMVRANGVDELAYEPKNVNIQTHIASTSNPHSVTKAQVGLSNVDNTSDANKPISTVAATEFALKAPLASPALTGTPTAPTAVVGTSTTQLATTAFVSSEIANDTYLKNIQDWRGSMMGKAQFDALAAERRANRAGSGFDEFGENQSILSTVQDFINNGISVTKQAWLNPLIYGTNSNLFAIGSISKQNINGVIHKLDDGRSVYSSANYGLSYRFASGNNGTVVSLPQAPTVLPYDSTLTEEQIAMGVIKHADSSNSGLIVNGKFDTDTSGWSSFDASLSIDTNRLKITSIAGSISGTFGVQTLSNLVVGKKYIVEFNVISISSGSLLFIVGSGAVIQPFISIYSVTPTIGRNSIEFTATLTNHHIFVGLVTSTGQNAIYDNIAVFPADAISRSDLVFPESWHEDSSEKDFVYPLGNVQYLGTTGDSGAPVAGAFAGSATYSLFSDTWQADGALVGKGYVWSTLSDANKKAFVANAENNCYLDGDKVIQVRYRIRVVAGFGDSWANVSSISINGASGYPLRYGSFGTFNLDGTVKPKGKKVALINKDIDIYKNGMYLDLGNADSSYNKSGLVYIGAFCACNSAWAVDIAYGYEGKCYALPIALVHRRNQGGYNATYNSNGTKAMTMTPTSIADCFNIANLTTATGYIGTSTPRPDGLFYDQISVEDFKPSNKGADLRNSSKKRTAQSIIEEFAPKALASTIPYYNNDTTPLTTYKDFMEVRDTSGNRYGMVSKVGNVATIGSSVANKKGFSIVTKNGKQYLQVADDVASDATVQMNLSTVKYDIGVFDA